MAHGLSGNMLRWGAKSLPADRAAAAARRRRIEQSCDILNLSADQDYRRLIMREAYASFAPVAAGGSGAPDAPQQQQQQQQALYFWPLGREADEQLHATWLSLTRAQPASAAELQVRRAAPLQQGSPPLGQPSSSLLCAYGSLGLLACPSKPAAKLRPAAAAAHPRHPRHPQVMFGRTLEVPRSAAGAAWFAFEQLCARPLGPADYLSIAQAYHTVFLRGVPAMSMRVGGWGVWVCFLGACTG
jgi:predicted ATPase